MTKLLAAALVGLLAGSCATTSPAEQRSADEARCHAYGFRRGTEAFAKCLLDVDLDRAADRRSRFNSYPYGPGGGGLYWRRPYGYW